MLIETFRRLVEGFFLNLCVFKIQNPLKIGTFEASVARFFKARITHF